MAAGRHIVHRKVADDYIELLAQKAKALPVGDPFRAEVAVGPIINAWQVERIHKIVTDTVAAGAQLAAGGTFDGLFYNPTVLTDVTGGMPVYDLEIFGPVAPVIIVEDEEEAIRVANDTEYGLSGAVQTGSLERGLRVASQIRSGLVHINDQTVHDMAGIPFGGSGASGNGSRFGSTTNIDEFTEWQWMTIGGQPARYPSDPSRPPPSTVLRRGRQVPPNGPCVADGRPSARPFQDVCPTRSHSCGFSAKRSVRDKFGFSHGAQLR
jgi:benzaldehyde dehydrogenase (NAD)